MPTGNAPTTSEWSTIILPTEVHLILDVWQHLLLFKLFFTIDIRAAGYNKKCFTFLSASSWRTANIILSTMSQFFYGNVIDHHEHVGNKQSWCIETGERRQHGYWTSVGLEPGHLQQSCQPLTLNSSSIYIMCSWFQLECLHSENTPAAPWLPILLIHIGSQVKTRQSPSYKFKKFAKNSNVGISHKTLDAIHL